LKKTKNAPATSFRQKKKRKKLSEPRGGKKHLKRWLEKGGEETKKTTEHKGTSGTKGRNHAREREGVPSISTKTKNHT